MKIELKKKDENLASIIIETDAGRASEEYKKTARKFAKHVNIPGFRKGKAPIKMIESQVGVDTIKSETLSLNFISEILFESFKAEKLEVSFIPSIDKVDLPNPEGPVFLEATIELFPELKLPNYKGLKATVEVAKFEKDDYIDETLAKIATQFTEFENTTEALDWKDEVIFDFDGRMKETGESKDSLKATAYQTIFEKGRFVEGFLEQMLGMKVAEEKEIEVTFPADYFSEEMQNKVVIFKIKIQQIARPKAPNFDDEFAKKLGSETMADLKKRIEEEMDKLQTNNEKSAAAENLMAQVLEKTVLDVPKTMIDREVHGALEKMKSQYGFSDKDWEEFRSSNLDLDKERNDAEERIRRSLVVSEIVKVEKLEVTKEEIDAKAQEILPTLAQQLTPEQSKHFDMSQFMNNLSLDLLTNKAVELIIDQADLKYNYVKPGEESKVQEKSTSKPKKKAVAAKKPKHDHDHDHKHGEGCC